MKALCLWITAIAIIVLLLFSLEGCIAAQKTVGENTDANTTGTRKYSMPSGAQEMPVLAVTDRQPQKDAPKADDNTFSTKATAQTTDASVAGWGYRVQVFSTVQQDEAKAKADEIASKLDIEVFVEFDPPYYKVRAGNCQSSDEAEKLLSQLKRAGYTDAWTVRSRVVTEKAEQ